MTPSDCPDCGRRATVYSLKVTEVEVPPKTVFGTPILYAHWVTCEKCKVRTYAHGSEAEAVAAWNKGERQNG